MKNMKNRKKTKDVKHASQTQPEPEPARASQTDSQRASQNQSQPEPDRASQPDSRRDSQSQPEPAMVMPASQGPSQNQPEPARASQSQLEPAREPARGGRGRWEGGGVGGPRPPYKYFPPPDLQMLTNQSF